MTGFGVATLQTKKYQLSIQIKSVNGRFLETKFRLPKSYFSYENELKAIVSEYLFRGSVEVYINKTQSQSSNATVIFKTELAKAWIKESLKLAKELKLNYKPQFEDLLKISDLYEIVESDDSSDQEKEGVLKTLKSALEDCVKSKKTEGEKLSKNLHKLVGEVEDFVVSLDKKRPELESGLKKNLEKKIKELALNTGYDEARLHQESVYLVEKADIEEEITRLKAHLQTFKKTLNEKSSVGKKLDFLVQEMHREINTMGAKTQNLNALENIINAKAFVEKIKEQVQNIE